MKKVTTVLAAAALGMVSLGAAACNDDGADAASSAPVSSPATSGGASSTPSASTGVPSSSATPQSQPTRRPKVANNQVIMIDPDGKTYTRKWIIQNAMGMAAFGKTPSNFCSKSYAAGVKGGGKFPAGKQAFMEACEEGVSLGK
ncbi:MAG: hypothetical protein ACRDP6_21810 [Actinoallomurus sp.]